MIDPSRSRPPWQHDPCPAWCVVEHDEADLLADRVHDSAGRYTPAVLGGPLEGEQATTELLILMSRRSGDAGEWVFVGQPERDGHHLSLSREGAVRVAHEILRLASGSG
ncbi:DUF6907 domain-containing protein [Aeromicrobium sp. Sec7.5]|uniref:DUF6907 domain-containing protein n=1 Tax=Aeromicrobium sp. Sec7.5 TaxID=3121276 RepID=UPI002FE49ECC